MLQRIKPDSPGKAAALARAARLTDFRWTPVRDITTYTKKTGVTKLPAGVQVLGMPYSSPEPVDKFITENVSFETLLSAMANPDSVLYTKDLGGANNSWIYYGIVCNGLARYALGIRRRFSTKRWPTVPGMHKIADAASFRPEVIALCDILYAHCPQRSHVAMITGLLQDESGKIVRIEVSESVRPSCLRADYSLEEFYQKYALFALWRYDGIDAVTDSEPETDALLFTRGVPASLPEIAVNAGDKSNYDAGEDVVLSVFGEGEHEIILSRNGTEFRRIRLSGRDSVTLQPPRGYYTALLSETGASVQFCVCEAKISASAENGRLTLHADPQDPDSRILYFDFRETRPAPYPAASALAKIEELTAEEIESGTFTRPIPEDAGFFKVYFVNRYGVWTHRMRPLPDAE